MVLRLVAGGEKRKVVPGAFSRITYRGTTGALLDRNHAPRWFPAKRDQPANRKEKAR